MEDFGVAKGYIELDISNMKSSVSSAQKELEKIERSGKLAQSEFDKLEAVSKGTGSAFEEAANRANILSRYISTAKDKTTVYKKEIDGLNTIIKRSGEEQAKLKTKIENTSSQYEKSKEKLNSISDAYKAAQKEIKTVTDEYKAAQKEIKAVTDEYGKNSDEAKEVAEKHKEVADKYKEVTEKHKEIISSYEKAADATDKYRNELEQLKSEHNALDMEIDESKEAIIDFQTKANETETSISNMAVQLAEAKSTAVIFGREMQDAGDKIQAAGDKINSIGSKLTVGVTTPLVGAGGAAVNFALQAGDSLAKVSTIADETVLSMDQISAGAMEVSNDTGVAFADFNEALYQTISATGDTANAIGYTEIAAKAAKGGFTDTATAVDGLTTIMNSYGLSGVDNMQKVSDMMLMTQNYGKTTFGELASSMGQVIPITSQLDMSIEEVMSIMATLTKNGIGTSEAVTGLKAALSNIISPSTEAAKAADLLGLDFSASALQSKGMTGVMEDVKAALQQASPEFAELSEKVAVNKLRLAELEEQGEKSSDEYKNLKKETKGMEQSMETLAQAADSPIGGFATLFGSVEGLNSMMVLTSDTGAKDMQGAMDAMKGSAGATEEAFDKMNNSDMGKIKKELNKLKNTGIEVGNKLLPMVTKAVGFVGDLAEKFSKLSPKEQEAILKAAGFAAALGPVLKVTGTATTGIGKMTSGVGSLLESFGKSKAKADVLKNGMEAVEKGALNANSSVGGFSGILSKLGSPLGVAALATTAIVGVGTAFAIANEKAKKANLEEHFGTVKLSAEEVEDVAKRLTTNDWTMRLDAEIEARQKLEEFESSIQTAVDDMNKAEWKVSVGMELTEEERENYKSSVNNYVTSVQDYIEQQHYTANLAIDAVFEPGTTSNDNFKQFSDDFYNGLYSDLQALGEKLADQVNNAWEDNVMTDEETNAISRTREEIQKELDKIAKAEYQLKLENIQASANTGTGLTAESFEAMQKQLSKEIDNRKKDIEQSKVDLLLPYQVQLNEGEISLQEFSEKKREVEQQVNNEFGELIVDAVNVEIGTIKSNYSEELGKATNDFKKEFEASFNDKLETVQYTGNWAGLFDGMENEFRRGFDELDNSTKSNISTMLENMEPQTEQLTAIADKYLNAGKAVPDSISQGLLDVYQLEVMAGNTDHLYELLGAQMSNSPEFLNVISEAERNGTFIPENIKNGISLSSGQVYDEQINTWRLLQQATEDSIPTIETLMAQCGISSSNHLINSLIVKSPEVYDRTLELLSQMGNGTSLKNSEIQELMQAFGINASDSLLNTLANKAPSVQGKAIDLLSEIKNADKAKRPEILAQLMGLGVAVDDSIGKGLYDNLKVVKGKSEDTIDVINTSTDKKVGEITPQFVARLKALGVSGIEGMEEVVKESDLEAPDMQEPDWTYAASQGWDGMQNFFDRNPLTATMNLYTNSIGSIGGHANGGFVEKEQLSWLAEGNRPEVVIPLDTNKRATAMSLYEQTGVLLGIDALESARRNEIMNDISKAITAQKENVSVNVNIPEIDFKRLAKDIAKEIDSSLRRNPISPVFEVKDGDVYDVNYEKIARKTAPTISRIISKKL
ncbi:phage tail tape measure protein [Blautia celeris]|uniref:phage tail tape measure protein n=1 Tax=Blautia celeris TaxID=2763026 RepID=UPI0031BB5EEC